MKRFKFNVIDFIIIIAVAAVIGIGVYILGNKSEATVSNKETEVVLTIEAAEIDGVRKEYYEANAKAGDKVSVGVKEKVYGELQELSISPAKELYENPKTGEKAFVDSLDRYDAHFTIRLKVVETDRDFLIGTDKVKVGTEQKFEGGGYTGYGYVVAIKKVGGGE